MSSRTFAAVAVALVVLASTALPAVAVPSATTPYPQIVTAPGEQLDVTVQVDGDPGERVALALQDVPDGWEATLRAGGFEVGAVTVPPGGEDPAEVTLELVVPPDASGTATLVVVASSDAGTDRLPVVVEVAETAGSAVALESEFTTLTGAPDDTFEWSVTLRNDVPQETTFQLRAAGPQGWLVQASPATEARANAVTVEGGGTATVRVEATPPTGVEAGTYPVVLEAVGASGRTAGIELVAEVTGSPQLVLTTPSERLNASGPAGTATPVVLLLRNDGSAPAEAVTVSASPPSGWEVEFEPASIAAVPAGESVEVTARVTPARDAIAGDYVVSFRASSERDEAASDVRFTVETSATWGLAALAVVLLVAALLAWVFRRYGRR